MLPKIPLKYPINSQLPPSEQHFLAYIPWEEKYLDSVPMEFKDLFKEVLPKLSSRSTDVHTAICLSYLDEFINKAQELGLQVNRKVLAYSLMLHDVGWSEMNETEIAASLGIKGLKLNKKAMAPKEKHAKLGAKFAKEILSKKQTQLNLTNSEIDLIAKAILYHDQPEKLANAKNEIPVEMKLLVDLDHIWSFTQLNFWQDTVRKNINPQEYVRNLERDLESYFVTPIGKNKAKELLAARVSEIV